MKINNIVKHFFIIFFSLLSGIAVQLHAAAAPEPPRLCILGSCSGTEPMRGRHHTALTIETAGKLYLFDAGENCAYTGTLSGIDWINLNAVFISHPHFDHVGGLGHVLWTRSKLSRRYKREFAVSPLPVYAPLPQQIETLADFLGLAMKQNQSYRANLAVNQVHEGLVFDDGVIKVEALANRHILKPADRKYSFSYRISINGKIIVFSGDIRNISELDPFLGNCDILLVETGHHKPWQIAETIRKNPAWQVRRLIFLHHGRDILNHPESSLQRTAEKWGKDPEFASDAMFIKL